MPAVPLLDWDQLCAVAYGSERVLARRLARRASLTESVALNQLLQAVAAPRSLTELVASRLQALADAKAHNAARKQEQTLAWQRKQADKMPSSAGWTGWFDGSAWPNPGNIGLGALLRSPAGCLTEFSLADGHGDSNQAEYMALLILLEAALAARSDPLLIHGDSRVVIDDVTGVHCVASLNGYRTRALAVLAQLGQVRFCWVPRRRNAAADALSQRARHTSTVAACVTLFYP
ncbi:MAG: ribonuclease HI [Burkholderiaceae bacterium]|jgi:ribonuclease HI